MIDTGVVEGLTAIVKCVAALLIRPRKVTQTRILLLFSYAGGAFFLSL